MHISFKRLARPFAQKKNHPVWGYVNSTVSISKGIAAQDEWGPAQIEQRGGQLATRALALWRPLVADAAMVAQLELDDAKERSAGYKVDDLKWGTGVQAWFEQVRSAVRACSDVVELPRAKSVVYRAPEWFVEIIPRAKGFVVRLAADAADLVELTPEVQEAAAWTFVVNSTVGGGSLYVVASHEQAETACALVERTYQLMFE